MRRRYLRLHPKVRARRVRAASNPSQPILLTPSPVALRSRASTVRDKYLKAYVSRTMHERFQAEAARQNKTVSALLQELVGDYLAQVEVQERWSALRSASR